MNIVLQSLLCVLVGYALGNFSPSYLLGRIAGYDIRKEGSGNAGASNALVTMGKGPAAISAFVDILKAFLPVFLLLHVIPYPPECTHLPAVTGVCIILGHMFPFWMQFRGGKGFASLLGLSFALSWQFLLICLGILAVILLVTRYIALASILCAAALPVFWFLRTGDVTETILFSGIAVIIISKHIQNIKRIANGTEIPLGHKKKKQTPDSGTQTKTHG